MQPSQRHSRSHRQPFPHRHRSAVMLVQPHALASHRQSFWLWLMTLSFGGAHRALSAGRTQAPRGHYARDGAAQCPCARSQATRSA